MTDYYDLGQFERVVSSDSSVAQQWFSRGLTWIYGFDPEMANRCFTEAIKTEPNCAMHYWGLAYSSGCYYNLPWKRMQLEERKVKLQNAYLASRQALKHVNGSSEIEIALVEALTTRYQSEKLVSQQEFDRWDDDYADAMRIVYENFPKDNDVCALFAEALMSRTPWALWDLKNGDVAASASTEEAIAVLESTMRRIEDEKAPVHPGVLHMYIHVMEMSPFPERALRACDALRTLIPGSGHLCHMPSHIDVRCGNYHDAVVANDKAIQADREYLRREGAMNFHTTSRIHNFHLKIYAALFLGQYQTALSAAEELVATTPEELLRIELPPMADWMEGYIGMKAHVYIRFGKWQEIIAQAIPEDPLLYCVTTAVWRYAKAIAFAVSGDIASAEEQRKLFDIAATQVPESRRLFNNTCVDILQIAEQMLIGELEYRKCNYEIAFQHLRNAVYLDDNLKYDEPWGWMQPARHALGALLLEQDHVEQAMEIYSADLGLNNTLVSTSQHPNNVWSLHGYVECLNKLERTEEARQMQKRLRIAEARADVPIRASCLCRNVTTS